jgi:hypothetical protein
MLNFAESGINHRNWLTFCRTCEFMDPRRRLLMMVRVCNGTCYVPFWVVVVHTYDPKDLFMKCVTMFTA